MTHGNINGGFAPFVSGESSEMSEEKGGCNHRTPRGDGARKRGLRSQWLSVASPFSPATRPLRQAGLPFLSFLSRVSRSWPILPTGPSLPFLSLSFSRSHSGKNFHSPESFSHSQINTWLIPSSESRIIIYGSVALSLGWMLFRSPWCRDNIRSVIILLCAFLFLCLLRHQVILFQIHFALCLLIIYIINCRCM